MVEAIAKVAATHQVRIATFGHAGDGNLHPTFLYDRRDQAESARVAAAVDDIFRAALDLGGTLSGDARPHPARSRAHGACQADG